MLILGFHAHKGELSYVIYNESSLSKWQESIGQLKILFTSLGVYIPFNRCPSLLICAYR